MSNYFANGSFNARKTAEEVQALMNKDLIAREQSFYYHSKFCWQQAYEYHLIEKLTQSHLGL
jgi:hypothetical protein